MRKFVSLLLIFAMLFTFAACENTPQTSSAGESSEVSEPISENGSSYDETSSVEVSASQGMLTDEQFEALLNAVAYVRECYDSKKIAFRLNSRIFPDSLIGYEESAEWVIKIDNVKQRVYVWNGWNDEYKAEGTDIYCRKNGKHSWKTDSINDYINSFEDAKKMMFFYTSDSFLPLLDASDWEKSDFLVVSETEEAIAFVTNRFLLKEVDAYMSPLYMNRESKQQISTTMLILHKNNGRLYQLRTQFELSDESEDGGKGRLRFQEGNWFFGYEDDLDYRVSNYPNGYPIIRWDWD